MGRSSGGAVERWSAEPRGPAGRDPRPAARGPRPAARHLLDPTGPDESDPTDPPQSQVHRAEPVSEPEAPDAADAPLQTALWQEAAALRQQAVLEQSCARQLEERAAALQHQLAAAAQQAEARVAGRDRPWPCLILRCEFCRCGMQQPGVQTDANGWLRAKGSRGSSVGACQSGRVRPQRVAPSPDADLAAAPALAFGSSARLVRACSRSKTGYIVPWASFEWPPFPGSAGSARPRRAAALRRPRRAPLREGPG